MAPWRVATYIVADRLHLAHEWGPTNRLRVSQQANETAETALSTALLHLMRDMVVVVRRELQRLVVWKPARVDYQTEVAVAEIPPRSTG
jgi:hypothetical protein